MSRGRILLGAIAGAIVGGLLLGVVDNFAAAYLSAQYRAAIPLFLLIAVILFGLYVIALVTLIGAGITVTYELHRLDSMRRPCSTTTTLTSPSSTARPSRSSASAPKATPTP